MPVTARVARSPPPLGATSHDFFPFYDLVLDRSQFIVHSFARVRSTTARVLTRAPFLLSPFFLQNEDPKFAQIMRIKNNKQRLRKFTDSCKTKTICPSTGTPQPQYRLEGMKITAEFKKLDEDDYLPEGGERKQVITPEKALSILKNVSDEDCRILGLDPMHAHPSWFILQALPVPPHPGRPATRRVAHGLGNRRL